MIDVREHDFFYLKEKKYFKKPKHTYFIVWKLIQKYSQKNLVFADIGSGDGSLIKFLKNRKTKWDFVGTDIIKKLLKNVKKITKCKTIFDDISVKTTKLRADILNLGGVINCFDHPEIILNNILLRCNKKAKILINDYFNDEPIDFILRYRDNNKKKFKSKINQKGFNRFSKQYITFLLKKNKFVKSFKFIKIKFPKKINVKKTVDKMRTWTTTYENKKIFINALGLVQDRYILLINLK